MTDPHESDSERLIQYLDGERWIRWHGNTDERPLADVLADLRKRHPGKKFRLIERTDWVLA